MVGDGGYFRVIYFGLNNLEDFMMVYLGYTTS